MQPYDLYVLPTLWEGLPMVLLEAMAAMRPIISANVGGVETAITHVEDGSLIMQKDPASISKEVVRLFKNPDIREKYIKNRIETFIKEFISDIMTERYQKLYVREA